MEQQDQSYGFTPQKGLPNATAVLVLGILSIVVCFCYGILGIICGIIALVLAGKDQKLYKEDAGLYTSGSYSNLKAGKVCAIIGLVISILYLIVLIFFFATIGFEVLKHPEYFMHK